MNIQDARRSLAKWLNEEPDAPVGRAALATMLAEYDRLAAIRDGLGKAQEPVGRVLAEDEMGIGYDRRMGDVIWFSGREKPGFLYQSPHADSAQVLVEALKARADAEYVMAMKIANQPEAMGWVSKVKSGQFGQAEMQAHIQMNKCFGAHESIYAALAAHKSEVKG